MAGSGAGFVVDVGLALGMAAGASLVARRLGIPSIVSYLGAGLVLGPYVHFSPLHADPERLHELSEFGVVLVMFAVGLELRLRRLVQVLPASGFTGLVQMATLWWAGQTAGQLLGWSPTESLFLGGCLAISSTMVVSKVLEQHPVAPAARQHIFGVLVLQDVAAVALITLYTAIASGSDLSWSDFGLLLGGLSASLLGMIAVGMLFVPPLVRRVVAVGSSELLTITATGLCFGFALLAAWLGYSVALGAFVAGVLVAESGESHAVEHAVAPLKEVFAAIFFVSIGMTVDPGLVWTHIGAVAVVSAVVIAGQFLSVTGAGLLSGLGMRRSITAGLALGQLGEFAFVIAGIGAAAGVTTPALTTVCVAVAVITTFTTPQLVARAEPLLQAIDHALPRQVRHALTLHEAAVETLRSGGPAMKKVRNGLLSLVFDVGLLLLLIKGTTLVAPYVVELAEAAHVHPMIARGLILLALLVVATPVVGIIIRQAGRTAEALVALLPSGGTLSPKVFGALRLVLLLVVWLGVGAPILAIFSPFLHGPLGPVLIGAGALGLAGALWRELSGREEEVRSATARVVELLGRNAAPEHDEETADEHGGPVETIGRVVVPEGGQAVGRSLIDLDLRARTGATAVRSIDANGQESLIDPSRPLQAGDTLELMGAPDELRAARKILTAPALTLEGGAPEVAEPRSA